VAETQLSTKEFSKILKEGVEAKAAEHAWDCNKAADRGYAFQRWVADVLVALQPGFDTEPEDACLYSQDLKADLVFEDSARNHLLICQCKYQSQDKAVDETEVNDFFNRHEQFLDRAWIKKHGSAKAVDALGDYAEKIASGYSATYYFISTGKASERVLGLADTVAAKYDKQGTSVTCELLDFGKLKDYYVRSLSLELSGPSEVTLQLPTGRFFIKDAPYLTLIAVIKGNWLRDLYKRHKESLYAWNIRGYLGNRGINKSISDTAEKRAGDFFYFNNGVSAICTDFELEEPNTLRVKNIQIINGAQTVSTLAKAEPHTEIDVLFRLTKTVSVKTEKGINREIIQYNNSQNVVRVSDFRANDEIQIWLEKRFKEQKRWEILPEVFYLRKRTVGRRGTGRGLRLEDLAKVRFAFLYEPTLIHDAPKKLWSLKEDEGLYEQAFGVDGALASVWSDETFEECLLAIAAYVSIEHKVAELGGKDEGEAFAHFRRLRFHALSLFGIYVRARGLDPKKLLRSKSEYEKVFADFWSIASTVLDDVYSNSMDQGMTLFAFIRNSERWQQVFKRFAKRMTLSESV
jgi:hypothetical protein